MTTYHMAETFKIPQIQSLHRFWYLARPLCAGWSQALRIPDAREYYYPVGAVECCTPSLLLSNGDARPLERCNCVEEPNVNCGGEDSSRLLTGYARFGGDRTLG